MYDLSKAKQFNGDLCCTNSALNILQIAIIATLSKYRFVFLLSY